MASPPANDTGRPTRARHLVLVFAAALSVISFVERAAVSQAALQIRADLRLQEIEWGVVTSVFTFAYAVFEIPMGRLGDRFGPRSILLKVVWMFSFFSAATGWVWNRSSLVLCRFLFGVGEAGAFPNLTKVFTIWLPAAERGRAQGVMWLCGRWGAAVAPMIMALLMTQMSWRVAFMLLSLLGVGWALAFGKWFRDRPRECPGVNAAELALLDGAEVNAAGHVPAPWGLLVRRPTVWLLCLQYFLMAYGWYFYISWLPTYLLQARGLDMKSSALLASIPLLMGGVGCFIGGWVTQRVAAALGDLRRARKLVAGGSLLSACVMMLLFIRIEGNVTAMVVLGLASFSVDLVMASAWGACMDVGGRHAGALSGCMNMMNLGGAFSQLVIGFILNASKATAASVPTREGWSHAFLMTAGGYLMAAACWRFIDPLTPLEQMNFGQNEQNFPNGSSA